MVRSARAIAVGGLLAALLVVPSAIGARSPSFSTWHARWLKHSGAKVLAVKTRCAMESSSSDLAAGRCIAKGALAVYPPLIAEWNREVAVIARGQPSSCRAAIHAYWLATAKNYAATVAFFRAHRESPVSTIAADLNAKGTQVVALRQTRAARRAEIVCG